MTDEDIRREEEIEVYKDGNLNKRSIREKIASWIIMLDSSDFKETDADIVREEMLELINLEDA